MDENTASVIAAFVTGILGFYGSKILDGGKQANETARERFNKAYLPLFVAIDPYLYKKINAAQAEKIIPVFESVLQNSYELLNPYLSKYLKAFIDGLSYHSVDQRAFELICRYVDIDYERLKSVLHLPKRNILFKYRFEQRLKFGKEKADYYLDIVIQALLLFCVLTSLFVVFASLQAILTSTFK
ncbi:MAG: hypothetical protein KID04_14430 [Clostridium sp.]|nr:hypothetical protein [Clostridium sp.]